MNSIPEMSIDTRMLADAMRDLASGDTITYAALSALIGRDVCAVARHVLASARNVVMRDDGIVTESVMNVGIKRLTSAEVVGATGDAVRRRIRNASKRAVRKLSSVAYDTLTPELKTKHNTDMSVLGVIAHCAKDSSTKRITKAVESAHAALPLAKTLEHFA